MFNKLASSRILLNEPKKGRRSIVLTDETSELQIKVIEADSDDFHYPYMVLTKDPKEIVGEQQNKKERLSLSENLRRYEDKF